MKKSKLSKRIKQKLRDKVMKAKGARERQAQINAENRAVNDVMRGLKASAFDELETEFMGLSNDKSEKYQNIILQLKDEVNNIKDEYQDKIDELERIKDKWRAKQQEQEDNANDLVAVHVEIKAWVDNMLKGFAEYKTNVHKIENVQQIVYDAGKAKNIP